MTATQPATKPPFPRAASSFTTEPRRTRSAHGGHSGVPQPLPPCHKTRRSASQPIPTRAGGGACLVLLLLTSALTAAEPDDLAEREAAFADWRAAAAELAAADAALQHASQALEAAHQALVEDRRAQQDLQRRLADRRAAWSALAEGGPQEQRVAWDERLAAALALGPQREPVVLADGTLQADAVLRLGRQRASQVGEPGRQQRLLAPGPGGRWLPGGEALRAAGPGFFWVDVDGAAALRQPARRGLQRWLREGGAFLWVILALGTTALALVLWRSLALTRLRVDPGAVRAYLRASDGAMIAAARRRAGLAAGLIDAHRHSAQLDAEARGAELDAALAACERPLRAGLAQIAVCAAVAPLLGLLGTVDGMITTFADLAAQGEGDARHLSGGISVALLTTQAGLMVAVPVLMAHALLGRIAERRRSRLGESADLLAGHPVPEAAHA